MHDAVAGTPEAGRKARSPVGEELERIASEGAERRGELVKGAMLSGGYPWWTT